MRKLLGNPLSEYWRISVQSQGRPEMVGQRRKTDRSYVFFAAYDGMIPEVDCGIVGKESVYPEGCVARVRSCIELQERIQDIRPWAWNEEISLS